MVALPSSRYRCLRATYERTTQAAPATPTLRCSEAGRGGQESGRQICRVLGALLTSYSQAPSASPAQRLDVSNWVPRQQGKSRFRTRFDVLQSRIFDVPQPPSRGTRVRSRDRSAMRVPIVTLQRPQPVAESRSAHGEELGRRDKRIKNPDCHAFRSRTRSGKSGCANMSLWRFCRGSDHILRGPARLSRRRHRA